MVLVGLDLGMAADLGADHLHGPAGLLHLAHAAPDAEDEADGDQARGPRRDRLGRGRRRRRGEGRAAGGRRVPARPRRASRSSAPRCRAASCCTARPAPARRCWPRPCAHEAGANFYSQSAAAFVEMFAGLGASRIRRLFEMARENRPAIIFIDEIDAVGGERGSDNNSEREQTLNQLLVEMDGFESTNDLVVIAASNLLEKLDPALLRPGRFDRQIFVSPPDVAGREEIMNVHTRGKPLANVDLGLIARQTSGLTGADLANLCNEAAIFAARKHRDVHRPRRLRRRARARRRGHAVAPHAQRPRAPRRRVPRGRPRAVRRAAAGRRPRAQDLDRAARAARSATRSTSRRRTATSRRARSSSTT